MNKIYRTDIDGLRAIAVISVILFHLGFLPNGYLGVDIFFVISGYLITGILYEEVSNRKFSLFNFYHRRVRRIIPLVLFVTLITLIMGITFMLPFDLVKLGRSIMASNLSINNIIMFLHSNNYWDTINDIDPLMHTWSLGVEEQFYLLYPFIFLVFKKSKKYILPTITGLTLVSLFLFLFNNDSSAKFYLIHYRFFELSIGGICAIKFKKSKELEKSKYGHFGLFICLIVLVTFLVSNFSLGNDNKIILVTFLTSVILVLGAFNFETNELYKKITSSKVISSIGKISFSLYMWHQVVFAFARYFLFEKITPTYAFLLSFVVVLLSVFSYRFIENPFRNRKTIKGRTLLLTITFFFAFITGSSIYIFKIAGGIIRDIPELGLYTSTVKNKKNLFAEIKNIHTDFNQSVRKLDKPFSNSSKIKVLVIGNSFGRDFTNILLKSSFNSKIEVRYAIWDEENKSQELQARIKEAHYIFFGFKLLFSKERLRPFETKFNLDINKVWIVGTKDFGYTNTVKHYRNYKKSGNCLNYRSELKDGFIELNEVQKNIWKERYIDLIGPISDENNEILVFTPDCKFITRDGSHLTTFGASFYASLLDKRLRQILSLEQ